MISQSRWHTGIITGTTNNDAFSSLNSVQSTQSSPIMSYEKLNEEEMVAMAMEGIPVEEHFDEMIVQGVPVTAQPSQIMATSFDPVQQQWTSNFCDCCSNPACCYGSFCQPCLWGENMAMLEGSDCGSCCAAMFLAKVIERAVPCSVALLGGHKRTLMRKLFGISTSCLPEECGAFEDFCCHCPFCHCCATLQENHLLKASGATPESPVTFMAAMQAIQIAQPVVMVQPGMVQKEYV